MHKLFEIGLICGTLAAVMTSAARADVKVARVTYEGWKGAYSLSNGSAELVFVPQIGRIMRYRLAGGKNMLWVNRELIGKTTDPAHPSKDWVNFGGDKLWPAPQSRWNWPPDPYLDGGEHTVKILPNQHLLVTSPNSQQHGIRFTREIALDPTGSGVTITNTMENVGSRDVEYSVWEVTQVDSPDAGILAEHKDGHFSNGYYTFEDTPPQPAMLRVADGQVRLRRHPTKAAKIGADSPDGWAAAEKNGVRLTVSAAYEPGKNYPDDGCAQEIWANTDPLKYMELELLSPIQTVPPGQTYAFTTRWKLERIR